jgi:hypothetical protein
VVGLIGSQRLEFKLEIFGENDEVVDGDDTTDDLDVGDEIVIVIFL